MAAECCWPGCHIGDATAPWVLGRHNFSRRAFGIRRGQAVPDLSVDPKSHTLSCINAGDTPRAYFVSVRGHTCRGAHGKLCASSWRDADGKRQESVNFVLRLAPAEVLDVCIVVGLKSVRQIDLYSDIVELPPRPPSISTPPQPPLLLGFPLSVGPQPYLCSQAAGGALTHFAHASTWHAVDFDAPVGTPVRGRLQPPTNYPCYFRRRPHRYSI